MALFICNYEKEINYHRNLLLITIILHYNYEFNYNDGSI